MRKAVCIPIGVATAVGSIRPLQGETHRHTHTTSTPRTKITMAHLYPPPHTHTVVGPQVRVAYMVFDEPRAQKNRQRT